MNYKKSLLKCIDESAKKVEEQRKKLDAEEKKMNQLSEDLLGPGYGFIILEDFEDKRSEVYEWLSTKISFTTKIIRIFDEDLTIIYFVRAEDLDAFLFTWAGERLDFVEKRESIYKETPVIPQGCHIS